MVSPSLPLNFLPHTNYKPDASQGGYTSGILDGQNMKNIKPAHPNLFYFFLDSSIRCLRNSAAKNLFEKRFLDFRKLLLKVSSTIFSTSFSVFVRG